MSKIFDLIKRLCPDGVEFRELGDEVNPLTILKRGRVIAKTDLDKKVGNYPVYSSQTINGGEIGKIDTFDFDGEFVTWTTDGANAGTVFYRNGKFSITNVCGLIEIKDTSKLNYKFLFYWLSIEAKKHVHSGMGNAKLMSHQMAKIKLPVPPMEVQREIVRILDSFTLLTAELTAKLTEELTARKKQYEFYRDFLLSFDELDKNGGCELKMLGEIAEIASGGTPSTHNKIFWENGTIPWLKSEVCKDCIIEKSSLFITESGLNNSSAKIFKKGTVLMAMVGATIFKMAFLNIEAATNQNIAGIKANNKILMDKFLFYFLVKSYPELISKLSGYNMANLTQVKKIKIPIPSLQTQQKVVEILDKFDTLVNSITEGLPREIELRRKQYEHYRELLLNFKPKMTA